MKDRCILYQNGHFRLENEVACCSRLSGDSLKLLGLIMNRFNTAEAQGKELKTIAMSRLLLKRIFGNSVDRTVKNYAKRLKELGFIESYSLQGGDGGEFVCTINDRPENNPYVLLSRIENDVIYLSELQSGQEADALLEAFTVAVQAVEQDYVIKLRNAAENEREAILTAYGNYLRESLQANGGVCVVVNQTKVKTKKSKPLPTETDLPDDVQLWSYPEFENHFLREYRKVTGKKHIARNREGKTVADCIKELQYHYRDYEVAERKPMMKRHIDAFFVNYPPPQFTPTAFLMANSDVLCIVERYLETKVKHVPYEKRSFKEAKKREEAPETVLQMSLSKEQIEARNNALLKLIKGTATA